VTNVVGIEITKPLPETAVVDSTYKIEGSAKVFGAVGAPPFVYAVVKQKEWYKPEFAEDEKYIRAWPVPITGDFSIDFKPEKEGDYEVTVVATPAPLSLPAVGVSPVLAESDAMKVSVGQKPPAIFRFAGVTIDGSNITLTDHDADSGLLIQKKVTDTLEIIPSFEWVGASKTATISIKSGYRDWAGNFTPKTEAYTRTIELPESPDTPYSGVLEEAITIPLTACGDISDGAIEIVAKLPGMGDYISHIWNVYATKAPVVNFRFSAVNIDGNAVQLTDHDADSGLLLSKTTADSLSVTPAFEWQGSKRAASISIKSGYRDWAGGFTPKTDAYTATFELPDSIDKKYSGQLTSPISVPLIACGGLTDGAIEVVLKISGFSDYISHIWKVYVTEALVPEADIKDFDFKLTEGTYDIGDKVSFTAPYDYKGIAQDGQLTISLGTGPTGTFITKHTFSPVSVRFEEATDWETRGLEGSIVLPAKLEPGQMYSVRAKLETLEKKTQETDTDWSAFDIKGVELETLQVNIDPAGAGYVTTSPSPSGGTENNWQFPKGTTVYVTAHPASGYVFKSWSGEMTDTTALTAPVYPMTETRGITAHFEKEAAPEVKELVINRDPTAGGYVTTNPSPTTGTVYDGLYPKGTTVLVTAHPNSGYTFKSWSGELTDTTNPTAPVYMTEKRTITAHFEKAIPPPPTKVSFTVKGDGFPFLTSKWKLYHYDQVGNVWQDYIQHNPGDIITVRNVQSAGRLSCHCASSVTGEWSEQKYSREFAAIDGEDYKYDIASGIVYYR